MRHFLSTSIFLESNLHICNALRMKKRQLDWRKRSKSRHLSFRSCHQGKVKDQNKDWVSCCLFNLPSDKSTALTNLIYKWLLLHPKYNPSLTLSTVIIVSSLSWI